MKKDYFSLKIYSVGLASDARPIYAISKLKKTMGVGRISFLNREDLLPTNTMI